MWIEDFDSEHKSVATETDIVLSKPYACRLRN